MRIRPMCKFHKNVRQNIFMAMSGLIGVIIMLLISFWAMLDNDDLTKWMGIGVATVIFLMCIPGTKMALKYGDKKHDIIHDCADCYKLNYPPVQDD